MLMSNKVNQSQRVHRDWGRIAKEESAVDGGDDNEEVEEENEALEITFVEDLCCFVDDEWSLSVNI